MSRPFDRSPRDRVRQPKTPTKLVPVMRETDAAKLLDACKGKGFVNLQDEALVRLYTNTGARLSEVGNLLVIDVDLTTKAVHFHGTGEGSTGSVRTEDGSGVEPVAFGNSVLGVDVRVCASVDRGLRHAAVMVLSFGISDLPPGAAVGDPDGARLARQRGRDTRACGSGLRREWGSLGAQGVSLVGRGTSRRPGDRPRRRCQLQAMSTAARNLRPSHHTSGSPTSSQLNRPSPDAEFSASSIAFSIARPGVGPNEQPLKSPDALADVAVKTITVSDAAPIVSGTPIRRA